MRQRKNDAVPVRAEDNLDKQDTGLAGRVIWRVALACLVLVVLGVAFASGRTHIQLVTDWYANNAGWLMLLAAAVMLVVCPLVHRAETSDTS